MSAVAESIAAPRTCLGGGPLALATVVLGLGSFMNVLDQTIVNVSVPSIAGDLGVSPNQGTWAITSYAVSEAIMLPLTGWLALRLGQVRLFVTATLLFTLASVLCGLALNFTMLLTARVLQGVVGAAMIPMSQTLMVSIYPPEKRGMALGIWAMTTVVAPIAGPLVGGWITDNYSWEWIFYINLPIGLLVAFGAWRLVRSCETASVRKPVDFVGLGLLIVGVGALQILLDKGNELDWFDSNQIVFLGGVALIALSFFIAWELTDDHPLVNLRLFARRNFLVGATTLMLGSLAFFGTVVVIPLWLQTQMGYTSAWAGKAMAFSGIFAVILGPVVGNLIQRVDARLIATIGFLVFAGSSWYGANFTPDTDFLTVGISRLLMGIGISCFFVPLTVINLSGLSPDLVAGASGLANFMRNLGASFGTAIMTTLWDNAATRHHAELTEFVTRSSENTTAYLDRLNQLGIDGFPAYAAIDRAIATQAYVLSTDDVLLLSGAIMLCLITVIWWAKPPFNAPAGGGH